MISIEEQQKLLIDISDKIKREITAFAIGGTAMMFYGLKNSTLDIDLVFMNESDKNEFKRAAKKIGYIEIDSVKVYGVKNNTPDMLTRDDNRFDLFVLEVISFDFSSEMQNRAKDTHQFGEKLILKVADPHDLILMKCATDRKKDIDDAKTIANNRVIDWNLTINEALNQIRLGRKRTIFELGCFLEDLKLKMKVNIPDKILDRLYDLMDEEVKKRK